jgi:hypothetical protein
MPKQYLDNFAFAILLILQPFLQRALLHELLHHTILP